MGQIFTFVDNFIAITRLKKPTGSLFLLLPCLIAVFYQGSFDSIGDIDLNLITTLVIGSFVMRSAGCIINDLLDINFDKRVVRTKDRPLASGDMTKTQAIFILVVLLVMGLFILLQFHLYAIYCGIASLFLVILYPLMKRVTFFPQLFLGIVFNIGFILVLLHIQKDLYLDDYLIYFALILITFVYDTVYGFQDIDDDIKIGVKSSSIALRNNVRMKLNSIIMVVFTILIYIGYVGNYSYYYFMLSLLFFVTSFSLIIRCDYQNSNDCYELFKIFLVLEMVMLIAFILK